MNARELFSYSHSPFIQCLLVEHVHAHYASNTTNVFCAYCIQSEWQKGNLWYNTAGEEGKERGKGSPTAQDDSLPPAITKHKNMFAYNIKYCAYIACKYVADVCRSCIFLDWSYPSTYTHTHSLSFLAYYIIVVIITVCSCLLYCRGLPACFL